MVNAPKKEIPLTNAPLSGAKREEAVAHRTLGTLSNYNYYTLKTVFFSFIY